MQGHTRPTGTYSVAHEKETVLPRSRSPSPETPQEDTQRPLDPPFSPHSERRGPSHKRPGEPLDEDDNDLNRPQKNARRDTPPSPSTPMPDTPPSGVGASRHAPPNPEQPRVPIDINMADNPHPPGTDPASGRQIVNSRININTLLYTAPPPNGFPTPQITKPVSFAQSPQVLQLIEESPDHKIWIRPWGMRYTMELHLPRQEINKTMMDFLGRDPNNPITLIQPSPDKDHENEPDGNPWSFLISGLTEREYTMATKTGIIASKQATLFVSPYRQTIPNFIMMLMGISFDEGRIDEAQTAIVEAIRKTLSTNPNVVQSLTNLIEDPARVHIEFQEFLAGITATLTPVPNSQIVYWCIKSSKTPNFMSMDDYNSFIATLVDFQFFTGKFGKGEVPKRGNNVSCNLCKSRDHHSSYCPYPTIPGWLSPPDAAFPWTDPEKKKQNKGKGRGGANNSRGRRRF